MSRLLPLLTWLCAGALALLVGAHLVFFGVRAGHLLAYPYPLDYGEGPLQAQVALLAGGAPVWRLYGDPGAPPFAVVNYPPAYHLASAAVALAAGPALGDPARGALLAGRLVSLAASLLAAAALALLSLRGRPGRLGAAGALLIVLAALGIPIVREWSSVMRVDNLGICLGLWALVVVQRRAGARGALWAAPLLALSLLTKPTLLAAPAAAFLWLLFRDRRGALALAGLTAAIGAAAVALLQLGSGGWFWTHAVAANANAWELRLARGFWRDQALLLAPLGAAGALLALAAALAGRRAPGGAGRAAAEEVPLPLWYAAAGLAGALGVGKLGAYANYFLEAYLGLAWLAALGFALAAPALGDGGWRARAAGLARPAALALVALSLTRYYPLWSEEYLLPAGIVEGRNPARVSFGPRGVWQDLQRERVVLAARGRANALLVPLARAAGAPIFTDVPGVAAQAGVGSREQVFEHRMLYDAGLWDQRPLLRDMAGGRVPLAVLDYLGNWLTPQQIALLTSRYAQDVSVGTYSVYRPVDAGPLAPADAPLGGGVRLAGVRLAPSADPGAGERRPGELLAVTLELRAEGAAPAGLEVVLALADRDGRRLLETSRPLLYGALPPADWGGEAAQHMQALQLPPELPPGEYRLLAALRAGGAELAPPADLGALRVAEGGGQVLGDPGFYVPAPLLAEWERLGGADEARGPGDPVTPAVPFAGFVQQCFARACLRLAGGAVERLPVGQLAYLADAGMPRLPGAPPVGQLGEAFRALWDSAGGEAALGPLEGGEVKRFGDIVQYTRYARLERPIAGGPPRLGPVGLDVLRLPGGTPYRWPGR